MHHGDGHMTKSTVTWIVIGVVALVGILAIHSCVQTAQVNALKADYAEYKLIVRANDEMRAGLEAKQNQVIADKTKEIKDLLANVGKPTPAEQAKDKEIAALQAEKEALKAQGNFKEALEKSEAAFSALEIKFTLAEDRHKSDMFSLDQKWQGKFDALQAIADVRLTAISDRDISISKLENIIAKSEHKGIILKILGLKINLVRDVAVPAIAFGLGRVTGK